MTLAPLVALLLAAATPGAPPADSTARRPAVVVHRQPAIPIVAIRLSVLASDPPGYAGAGHLLQHLTLPALQEQVKRVGGEANVTRTSDALVYSVTGPASDLDHLAAALRSVLRAPRPSETERLLAERELAEERLAEWETAQGHARALLRAGLFPQDLPGAGTDLSGPRLTDAPIAALWGEIYRPERVSIVAVGDVELAAVERAFGELSARPRETLDGVTPDTLPVVPLAPAEATRGWVGAGFAADEEDPAVLTVAARLLADRLRARLPTAAVESEHWWTHHGQALVFLVASPEAALPSARRAVGAALTDLRGELSEELVRTAAAGARRELLFFARTPQRMADVVGTFTDRDGDPDAAQRFYDRLPAVTEDEVTDLLSRLLDRTPVRVDIPPQPRPKA